MRELLDTTFAVQTPEHIAFRFRTAGPLGRAFAYLIDTLIKGAIVAGAGWVAILLGAVAGSPALGLLLLVIFAVDWIYGGLFEGLMHGQTPGKKALGIRVIGVDGSPIDLGGAFLRNLLRAADWMPFGFVTGLACMLFTGSFRRLGDLAAGTIVVYARSSVMPPARRILERETVALARSLPAAKVRALDGDITRALASYVGRRDQFHPLRRQEIASHLAGPLAERLGIPLPGDADRLLAAIYLVAFDLVPEREEERAA